jgi:ribosomal protein S18 acetylase RimI-like enzyme
VTVVASQRDKRIRTAQLTAKGIKERALLDSRSDALARSVLDSLGSTQRLRLVAAMSEVNGLLTASMVQIRVTDPARPAAQHCLRQYFGELDARFPQGFDPEDSLPAATEETRPPVGVFLVAFLNEEPVGCGALKFHGRDAAELKRMWVATQARGLGVGRRLLEQLERLTRERGASAIRLETNKSLDEAIGLYRSSGYREVPPFNDEPYADHWFEKKLA